MAKYGETHSSHYWREQCAAHAMKRARHRPRFPCCRGLLTNVPEHDVPQQCSERERNHRSRPRLHRPRKQRRQDKARQSRRQGELHIPVRAKVPPPAYEHKEKSEDEPQQTRNAHSDQRSSTFTRGPARSVSKRWGAIGGHDEIGHRVKTAGFYPFLLFARPSIPRFDLDFRGRRHPEFHSGRR